MADKIDLKKSDKPFYQAKKNQFSLLEVPAFQFLCLNGQGDPNQSELFSQCCEALFSVAYKTKFTIKKSDLGIDYAVMPLEGLWWIEDGEWNMDNKSHWQWQLMIRQPDFVTQDHIAEAIATTAAKKPNPQLSELILTDYTEGLAMQTLHLGPYADEPPIIAQLHQEIKTQGYERHHKHHEIYLNDPNRTQPEKLKTVLRQPIHQRPL